MSVPLVASHRSTTSSRRPGVEIKGTVMRALSAAALCEACGTWWTGLGPTHAPHWALRDGRHVLVDCQGHEVNQQQKK